MSISTLINDPSIHKMAIESANMFVFLFAELTALFLFISFFVAIINQKLPAEKIQKILGAKQGRGYVTAAAIGAITPFCSCSTIPMLIGLLKAKAGFGPLMTFLYTSPLLNPIVIALFIPVLGLKATILYAVIALSISILAGVVLNKAHFEKYIKTEMLEKKPTKCASSCDSSTKEETSCCDKKPKKEPSIWHNAWLETWDMFKTMMPYMVIAMLIGSLVHGFVPTDYFTKVASADNPVAIPVATLIGIPLYIRVTTLLPLIGSFMAKGVSIGAIIALVIGSGGASLPEIILLNKLFKPQLLLAFLGVIFSMALICGYLFNLLL